MFEFLEEGDIIEYVDGKGVTTFFVKEEGMYTLLREDISYHEDEFSMDGQIFARSKTHRKWIRS